MQNAKCEICKDTRQITCETCRGTGEYPITFLPLYINKIKCTVCNGDGYVACSNCTKHIPDEYRYLSIFKLATEGNHKIQYRLGMMYLNEKVDLYEMPESEALHIDSFETYCKDLINECKEYDNNYPYEEYDDDCDWLYDDYRYSALGNHWLKKSAKQGNKDAQQILLKIYTHGDNYDVSCNVINQAVNDGYLSKEIAENALDALYSNIMGLPNENKDKLEKLFKEKRKHLIEFIQTNNDLDSNFLSWIKFIEIFHNYISFTPKENSLCIPIDNTEPLQNTKLTYNCDNFIVKRNYNFSTVEYTAEIAE